jgi:2-polyprenyl-3-methyl-5-hydroxy-6-metoxy-1,4-benzoquinol methylase
MKQELVYTGREIEAMNVAVNYHRWILREFQPYLGKRILEVGAGAGAFSELLLETKPESLTMLEPASNLYPLLVQRIRSGRAHQMTLREAAPELALVDSVVYLNVLEHIEDDDAELAAVSSVLAKNGHVLIFVPANPWLMSDMDRHFGHYRRYEMSELIRKCQSAGFIVRTAKYFDFLGIAPWLVKYRLMKSTQMQTGLVKLYDDMVVPVARFLEGLISPPIGKSILLIGEKSA